jgi:sec-independent protein translocase protein TatB
VFDIGFAELIIIAVVSLLVIGPERLPGAIRTGSLWLNKIKRSFNDIKQEVEQELHNDAVLQELRKAGEGLQEQASNIQQEISKTTEALSQPVVEETGAGDTASDASEKETT